MSEFDYQTLDDVVHSRVRLAIMAFLATVERAEFGIVRDVVKATDGNLSVHLRKLEDAGYVAVTKTHQGRIPATYIALTSAGRRALEDYTSALRELLGASTAPDPDSRTPDPRSPDPRSLDPRTLDPTTRGQ